MLYRSRARQLVRPLLIALTLIIVLAGVVVTSVAGQAESGETSLELVPRRDPETIREAIERARTAERQAERRMEEFRSQRETAKSRAEVSDAEMESLKQRAELAEDEGNEGAKLDFERQRGAEELRKKLYERLAELREAELDHAEAERELARARLRALETELDLVRKDNDLARRQAEDSTATHENVIEDIRSLERRTLDSQKNIAERQGDLADRLKDVIDRKKDLLEAQLAVRSLERG